MRKKLVGIVLLVIAVAGIAGIAAAQAASRGSDKFTDIPAGHWSDEAVGWAVDNGITTGTSDTTFSPDDTLTRAQMVTFLHRYHLNVADPTHAPPSIWSYAGQGAQRVTVGPVEKGIYTLQVAVVGTDRYNISVLVFDSDGYCDRLVNEVATNWTGTAEFEVGYGLGKCSPGTLAFQVTVISAATWTLSF